MPSLKYTLDGQEHWVPVKDRLRIGRSEANDLWIPAPSLSRHHAIIVRENEQWGLQDEGSSNGIVVKGEKLRSLPLQDGVAFRLGEIRFTFLTTDAPDSLAKPGDVISLPPETASRPSMVALSASSAVASEKLEGEDKAVAALKEARDKILSEISKVIIGQKEVLNEIMVALFSRGHCLMIGVPGLAKTLMVRALGSALDLDAKRIQFTPDLMPSDITGTDILEEESVTGKREFKFLKGPLFTNLLLADEINRTPPKTQAALLEAMQEYRVTASGVTYDLPAPFMVIATQNPIEQEGTYPLPEAQLDRFMFCVHLTYPKAEDEQRVLLETTRDLGWEVRKALTAAAILKAQHLVRQVPVSEHVALYALSLIRATRPDAKDAPDFIKKWVRWGAGTRAGQYLLLAAKAHVLLSGRYSVSCADIREHALPVMRHRIFCNFAAASEGVSTDDIIKKVLEAVKEPTY